jgi:hypothetical protein
VAAKMIKAKQTICTALPDNLHATSADAELTRE